MMVYRHCFEGYAPCCDDVHAVFALQMLTNIDLISMMTMRDCQKMPCLHDGPIHGVEGDRFARIAQGHGDIWVLYKR